MPQNRSTAKMCSTPGGARSAARVCRRRSGIPRRLQLRGAARESEFPGVSVVSKVSGSSLSCFTFRTPYLRGGSPTIPASTQETLSKTTYCQLSNPVAGLEVSFVKNRQTLLAASPQVRFIVSRQGPWNVDLETPPGPEGSNGTLLHIRRGYPGFSNFRFG